MTILRRLPHLARLLAPDRRGAIAVIFALASLIVLTAVGGAIDLGRSLMIRQQLSSVAELSCQYANRPSVVQAEWGLNGAAGLATLVKARVTSAMASQNASWLQTTAIPFTSILNGAGDITLTATVQTSILRIIGIATLPISTTAHCFDVPASPPQPVADASVTILVDENFSNTTVGSPGWIGVLPNGRPSQGNPNPISTPSTVVSYVGTNGTEWYITGYCLEVDIVGTVISTVPSGTHNAELDCDNGSGSAGSSSISTKVYLQAGSYDLRYYYAGRITNYNYAPAYICGSSASDISWATDTNYSGHNGALTNQINVYLDANANGSAPVHTTRGGVQILAGSNLIDACAYSHGWIERDVPLSVTTAGYYWLSFAADGANDSFGGLLSGIRLCKPTCPGSMQDNFPSTWTSTNGVTLFEDNFESPHYSGTTTNTSGNMNSSNGTSGGSSGWSQASPSGWATAPTNQVTYLLSGSYQGNQSLQLDNGVDQMISRPFLLVPGYYQISYDYISNATFASLITVSCGSTATAALMQLSGSASATDRLAGSSIGTPALNTNVVAAFVSHPQMASTPIGGGHLGSTTQFLNPSGTITTTPTVAPNGFNAMAQSPVNPVVDDCGYASSWQQRSGTFKIIKPAYYWLTLAALSSADGFGGAIDDVKLTALGSLLMTNPPSNPVTIPVPDPQPSATLSFSGFSISENGQ